MTTNFWGNTLRELRLAQGVSERQLAAVTKVNRSTLHRIERGIAWPDIMLMERLLDYLGTKSKSCTSSPQPNWQSTT